MDRNKRNRDFTLEIVIHLTRIRLLKHRFKTEFSVLQRTLRAILSAMQIRCKTICVVRNVRVYFNKWISLICCTNNCFVYFFFSLSIFLRPIRFTSHFAIKYKIADDTWWIHYNSFFLPFSLSSSPPMQRYLHSFPLVTIDLKRKPLENP